MKLFTLGPVEMYPYTLEEGGKQIPYFRTPEFSEIVLDSEKMIKELAYAECDEDKVLFITASGTGAMEASVVNCLTDKDKVLVIDGGSFGHRFAQLCEMHCIPYVVLKLELGETLTKEKLEQFEDENLTGVLVNIHETSTGQLYSLPMISEFCQRSSLFLMVDAISSFLVDPLEFSKSHVDVLILSSQKAFALAPGLSVVLLSDRAIDRVENIDSGCMYFDFKDHLKNGKRGQTPFTPAVGTILQLHNRLKHIREEGIDSTLAYASAIAKDFRNRIEDLPIKLPTYPISNACTPLLFEKGNAKRVYEELKEKYGMVLTPNGGELADTVLRVGHLGYHTIDDNKALIENLTKVINVR